MRTVKRATAGSCKWLREYKQVPNPFALESRACAEVPNCRKIGRCDVVLVKCLGNNLVSRWKAFLIHLALSLVIFAFLLAIILMVWYPGLLLEISGGWEGMRIVIGVDWCLGPC